MILSDVSFSNFSPIIPWQRKLVKRLWHEWDYAKDGTYEALCSGTVASGKSIIAAHIIVRHCIENSGAEVLIGRKALPDLKDTLFKEILEHLNDDQFVEGDDYFVNETRAQIRFSNGSLIIGRSWADRKYKKLGSLKLSAAVIEEAAENDDDDERAVDFIKMRVGRRFGISQSFILYLTNPDSPSHFLYKRFMVKKMGEVFYSDLRDNPFVPETYVNGMMETMDDKLAERMIKGKWVDIVGETLYGQYDDKVHYVPSDYNVVEGRDIRLGFDFNIGVGKPLSVCFAQQNPDGLHVFSEVVVDSVGTLTALEEAAARGLFDYRSKFIVNGDATGRSRDTRSKSHDYEIIDKFLSDFRRADGTSLAYEISVPRSNPPIKKRHQLVNAWLKNANGRVRLWVYRGAPTVREGLMLVKLKDKGSYVEDDSKRYQHVTTGLGYMICDIESASSRSEVVYLRG